MSMGAATRGGDLLAHSLSLFLQNLRRAVLISALISLAVLAAGVGRPTPENKVTWEILGKYVQGKVGVGIDSILPGSRYLDFEYGWGDWHRKGDARAILPELETRYVPLAKAAVRPYLWASAGAWVLSFLAVWFVFWRQGKAVVADKHVDGQEEVASKTLRALIQASRILPPENFLQRLGLQRRQVDKGRGLRLAGFEIPPKFVCRNQLITGGVGVGKSTAIYTVLDDLRARKIKAVIYDPHSEFSQKFYRKGKDFILNPTDKNCVAWDVFSDVVTRAQLVSMIKIMIPAGEGDQSFFTNNARKLLADLMLYVKSKDMHISEVYKIASESSLQELYDILCSLERSESKGDMDPAAAEQAQGIRSTLTSSESVRFLDLFPRDKEPFSIRKWMEKDDDSWLFITSQVGDVHELILPYISTTVDVALEASAGKQSRELRRALVIDEVDSAGRLPKLHKQLAQLRKFGVSILLGLQDVNQLLDVYGQEKTATIMTNCQTKLTCRVDHAETAQLMSKLLGMKEIEQTQTGSSWGAADIKDGESISRAKVEKPIIPARSISGLNDGEGYLKLPGTFPPCKIQIPHKQRPDIHGGYEPADGLLWDVEGQKRAFKAQEETKVQKAKEKAKNEEAEEEEF
jgi:hypothetical protein